MLIFRALLQQWSPFHESKQRPWSCLFTFTRTPFFFHVIYLSQGHGRSQPASQLRARKNNGIVEAMALPSSQAPQFGCRKRGQNSVRCSLLAPLNTTIGFSLVPSALAAKHTDTLAFSWPVVFRDIILSFYQLHQL